MSVREREIDGWARKENGPERSRIHAEAEKRKISIQLRLNVVNNLLVRPSIKIRHVEE